MSKLSPHTVNAFVEKFAVCLQQHRESTLAGVRQIMHNALPDRVKSVVGQRVVDMLTNVEMIRSLLDGNINVRFTFVDPHGERWHLHREVRHTLTDFEFENASAWVLDSVMRLSEDEFAQLALLLT